MKRFTTGKVAVGGVLASGLLSAAAAPNAARADSVEGDRVWVRSTTKGALGTLVRVRRTVAVAQDTSLKRSESVAGFRVETDQNGQQWVTRRYVTKGAQGAGFVRAPLQSTR